MDERNLTAAEYLGLSWWERAGATATLAVLGALAIAGGVMVGVMVRDRWADPLTLNGELVPEREARARVAAFVAENPAICSEVGPLNPGLRFDTARALAITGAVGSLEDGARYVQILAEACGR